MLCATPRLSLILLAAIICSLTTALPTFAQPRPHPRPHHRAVQQRAAAILDTLDQTGNFTAAQRDTNALFDQVLAYAAADDFDAFREAAYVRRLVTQLAEAGDAIDQLAMLRYLRDNRELGQAIAFAIRPDNRTAHVYRLLDTLRHHRGRQLNRFANLAAAISVVHERELVTRVNENVVRPPHPVALFDFYARHERQMQFGVRHVPVELLIYVVDIAADIDEMQWALREYAGHRQVGRLFHDIRYDQQHFRLGTPKRITIQGFNLPNIRQFGGVCADQAHFAVTVGKAIGVPAVYTIGRNAEVSHAWVGFLEQRGRTGRWNFDHGRYDAYRGVRGITRDPQTRQWVDDSYVSLLAELIGSTTEQRYAAAAMTDATIRLLAIEQADPANWPPDPLVTRTRSDADDNTPASPPQPRTPDIHTQLALLEAGLRESHGHLPGWLMLAHLGETGRMSLEQKQRWADVVMRLCGQRYPDFAVTVLQPMVQTIDDLQRQNQIWDRMFQRFRSRHDLAAEIRMQQGRMWEQAGEFVRAGQCYEDVIEHYANAGPFVLEAVERTEAMLRQANLGDRVLRMYDQTWAAVNRPADMYLEFQRQSTWYQLGMMYAHKLRDLGHTRAAAEVLARIENQTTPRQ